MNEVIKKLQNLYSWFEFYRLNNRVDEAVKTQQQITEYKKKHSIPDNTYVKKIQA